jgi:hypothetical protein
MLVAEGKVGYEPGVLTQERSRRAAAAVAEDNHLLAAGHVAQGVEQRSNELARSDRIDQGAKGALE